MSVVGVKWSCTKSGKSLAKSNVERFPVFGRAPLDFKNFLNENGFSLGSSAMTKSRSEHLI